MGWSVSAKKTVMSEGPFVFLFVHSPQVLSFLSAQTQGGSDFFTRTWSTLPPLSPYPGLIPNFTPQRDCPEIVFGFSVALSQRQEVGRTGGGLRFARFPPPTNLSTCKDRKSHELTISTGSSFAFPSSPCDHLCPG